MPTAVQQSEVDTVLNIFKEYGRPLGVSGVVLATAVVTEMNVRRAKFVMDEMERRGLIRRVIEAPTSLYDDLYTLSPTKEGGTQ